MPIHIALLGFVHVDNVQMRSTVCDFFHSGFEEGLELCTWTDGRNVK